MTDRIKALKRRIGLLEAEVSGGVCDCRPRGVTAYHTPADLAAIMGVDCPVHGARDLGLLVRLPPSSPLRPEDRDLCSCPLCAARDYCEGRRGPLSEEEREEEYRNLEEQLTPEGMERVRQEQLQVKRLIQLHKCRRMRADANSVQSNKNRW